MKTKIKPETKTDNKQIVEVKTVRTDEEANALFSAGWVLLHGGASHVDTMGYNAKPHFIMGREE